MAQFCVGYRMPLYINYYHLDIDDDSSHPKRRARLRDDLKENVDGACGQFQNEPLGDLLSLSTLSITLSSTKQNSLNRRETTDMFMVM